MVDKVVLVATTNNTSILLDGVNMGNLTMAGNSMSLDIVGEHHLIESNAPIYALHLTGIGCEVSAALLPSIDCRGSAQVTFSRPTSETLILVLHAKQGTQDNFLLNGQQGQILASAFSVVPGTASEFVAAKISNLNIPSGASTTISNSEGYFHLGILNGQGSVTGTRYGFFSDYLIADTSFFYINLCTDDPPTINGMQVTIPGVYQDSFETLGDCYKYRQFTIEETIYSLNVPVSICSNESYTLPNGQMVNTSGTYTTQFTAINGCDSIINTILTVLPVPTTTLSPTICQGATYTLPNGQLASTPGNYLVTVPGPQCDSIFKINLNVAPKYLLNVPISLCSGETYTLPTGQIISATGAYTVQLQSIHGCDSTTIYNVVVNPTYQSEDQAQICQGESYTLPNGQIVYNAGVYNTSLQTQNGCDSFITTYIQTLPTPSFYIAHDTCIIQGDSAHLLGVITSPLTTTALAQWQPSVLMSCDTCLFTASAPLQHQVFVLTITDQNGCSAADSVLVQVTEAKQVYIPNSFSPLSLDGNEIFTVFGGKDLESVRYCRIWDYWGELVFENTNFRPNDPTQGWNGYFRGKLMNPATFVYTVEVKFADGTLKMYKGDVSIIR